MLNVIKQFEGINPKVRNKPERCSGVNASCAPQSKRKFKQRKRQDWFKVLPHALPPPSSYRAVAPKVRSACSCFEFSSNSNSRVRPTRLSRACTLRTTMLRDSEMISSRSCGSATYLSGRTVVAAGISLPPESCESRPLLPSYHTSLYLSSIFRS